MANMVTSYQQKFLMNSILINNIQATTKRSPIFFLNNIQIPGVNLSLYYKKNQTFLYFLYVGHEHSDNYYPIACGPIFFSDIYRFMQNSTYL